MIDGLTVKHPGIYFDHNEKGQVTNISYINIHGTHINHHIEYDDKCRVCKTSDNESICKTFTTYEYDEYDRLSRVVRTSYGYDDVILTYEYHGDITIQTLKHKLYTNITKSDSHGNKIYEKKIHLDNSGWEIKRDFNYDDDTFVEEIIYTKENKVVATSRKKFSVVNDKLELIEEYN
jgi:YD repeat-containing protein